jgi:hypothetical protein
MNKKKAVKKPMDEEIKDIAPRRTWSGTYRDIHWEIQNFCLGSGRPQWTYYLFLWVDAFPPKLRSWIWLKPSQVRKSRSGKRVYYDYSYLDNLPWHCGVTWYSKEVGFDGASRGIKVGCDYSHYWDEGAEYNERALFYDVKETIDALWRLVPDMRVRCPWCGRWISRKARANEDCIKKCKKEKTE